MRILMSIPSLAPGGAERQFAELASGLAARGHQVLAVTLGQGGSSFSGSFLSGQGQDEPLALCLGKARLVSLGKASRLDNLRVALSLAGLLRREKPQVHYAFLPSCCVLGGLLQPFFPAVRLVMGVRASSLDQATAGYGRAGRMLHAVQARLAGRADRIIANSRAGREHCLERGFPPQRTLVVENGIDTDRLQPHKTLGTGLRKHWGVEAGERLVGLVARLDPMKDHANFLQAAALLATRRTDVRFVCVGSGPEDYASGLRAKALALGLGQRLLWAGQGTDMPRIYNALDLLCLSSAYGEGFPNVLGEAMSCGVPCVTTDVGDAALLVGAAGGVVPPRQATALAAGLEAMLGRVAHDGEAVSRACRERIVAHYDVQRMVAATETRLLEICP